GNFNEIKVFSKALTAYEVAENATATSTTDTGLVAYYSAGATNANLTSATNKVAGGPAMTASATSVTASTTYSGPSTASVTLDLQTGSDNGSSTSDNRTTLTNLKFDVLGLNNLELEVGDQIQMVNTGSNTVVVSHTVVSSNLTNGRWTSGTALELTASNLNLATHTMAVRLADAAGNVSTNGPTLSVTVATTAPVVLDMNQNGDLDYSQAWIDINQSGTQSLSAWVDGQDGLLFHDKYGDATWHDVNQVAFQQYGGATDLEGLAKAFDTNQDKVFDFKDADFGRFGVWQDANQDGVVDQGEFTTLSQAGIKAIDLVSDGVVKQVGDAVREAGRTVVHLESGQTMVASDAAFTHVQVTPGPQVDPDLLHNQTHAVI
ncbi:MAG: hypothetical protein EBU72_14225, partial [Betaproteobacteria bacterium]|nr:hypothetical protein [Betaproteobacteria bacterium]